MRQFERFGGKYRPEEDFPDVDAVIITAYDTNDVVEQMEGRCNGKRIALETIINDMMN